MWMRASFKIRAKDLGEQCREVRRCRSYGWHGTPISHFTSAEMGEAEACLEGLRGMVPFAHGPVSTVENASDGMAVPHHQYGPTDKI